MRIKVGRGSWTDLDSGKSRRPTAGMKKAANEMGGLVLENIMGEAASVSPGMLKKLGARIRLAANMEAALLMDTVFDVLEQNSGNASRPGGMSAKSMAHPNPVAGINAKTRGSVSWAPLTDRYYWAKSRKYPGPWRAGGRHREPGSEDKFFELSGELKAYLSSQGRTITNKFGGVTVSVKLKGMARGRGDRNTGYGGRELAMARAAGPRPERSFEEAFLGRITVKIFPNISPMLLPMLSSRSWTTGSPDGAFEAAYVGNQTMRQRLSGNGIGRQRHLLQPITQFFILNRIPTTITNTINRYIGRLRESRN